MYYALINGNVRLRCSLFLITKINMWILNKCSFISDYDRKLTKYELVK